MKGREASIMIPLRDETRRPLGFAWATALIIALNAGVFLVELALGDAFVTQWAATPADVASGHRLITLISSMFMHASWSHIIGNMVFLWAFGPQIEDAMGAPRYLAFYLAGGLAAMAAQVAMDPASKIPNLGASGAIAAVMGAFLVTYPTDRIRTVLILGWFIRITFIPAALLIGFWFLTQLISLGAVTAVGEGNMGGVAYMAHVGGGVFGALTARFLERPQEVTGPWS
jgi:membrane associated rhomboid family serine protease